jgi:hypothetical protein
LRLLRSLSDRTRHGTADMNVTFSLAPERLACIGLTAHEREWAAQAADEALFPTDEPEAEPATLMRVVEVQRDHVRVHDGCSSMRARVPHAVQQALADDADALAVGDWVVAQGDRFGDHWVVQRVPPRNQLARRLHDHRLYLMTYADIARTGHLEGWLPIYASPLGNILLVERRVVDNRLVLSCEHGLVEVDVSDLPRVTERASLPAPTRVEKSSPGTDSNDDYGMDDEEDAMAPAVLGRLGNEAFVLTRGRAQTWGLRDITPAELWGAPTGEITDIQSWFDQAATSNAL